MLDVSLNVLAKFGKKGMYFFSTRAMCMLKKPFIAVSSLADGKIDETSNVLCRNTRWLVWKVSKVDPVSDTIHVKIMQ